MWIKRFIFLSAFMSIIALSSAQDLSYSLSVQKIAYSIQKDNYCLVKGIYTNNSENDLVLWISEEKYVKSAISKEQLLKKYLLKLQGDASLMNLIVERQLSGNTFIVFKTFIKIIKPHKRFEVILLADRKKNMTKSKIVDYKNFLKENIIVMEKKKSGLIGKLKFNVSNMEYDWDQIIIPVTDLPK